MRIAIIGAGLTGLTAGLRLSQKNHQVTLFEKEKQPGGLAIGFKEKNWSWSLENFFHHLFTSDSNAKELIDELGLSEQLFFIKPKTSIYYQKQIHRFDSAFSLLSFPFLSLSQKIQVGAITAYLKTVNSWQNLEKITAEKWLQKYYGPKAYQILWQPLLKAKFGDQAAKVSMTWFWARIKKRSSQLGYLEGGFQILIDKLAREIKNNKAKILLNQEIKSLKTLKRDFDKVIVTTPTNIFFKTEIPKMLGALNLILVLKESFLTDQTYWLNINNPKFPFVAVVEQTNFVSPRHYNNNHILYVGGYYPQNHRYFKMNKDEIFKEFLPYLQKINPQLDARSYYLNTNLYSQPIIPINYSRLIPDSQPAPNIYLANMQTIYPWDRGMNYSIELGEKIANEISKT